MSNLNKGGTMRDVKEIQREIKRCEYERDLRIEDGTVTDWERYRMYNDRLWALRWVLEEKE